MKTGVTCVVPARLGSTRFFGKLLTPISGKPVVLHALERARDSKCFERIVCVTDSEDIAGVASAGGFDFVLTGEAANGTERIARALSLTDGSLPGDLFVNLQGDEPAFPPEGLRTLRDALTREPDAVHLLVHEDAPSFEELNNRDRVKAVLDADGCVVDFVRAIPRGEYGGDAGKLKSGAQGDACVAPTVANGISYRLQMGAYAYSRAYLARYLAAPVSAAELELSHEMLRDMTLAPLRAHAAPATHRGASVDAPSDLERAERALEELSSRPRLQASLQGTAL